jgi:hypothetical protein
MRRGCGPASSGDWVGAQTGKQDPC